MLEVKGHAPEIACPQVSQHLEKDCRELREVNLKALLLLQSFVLVLVDHCLVQEEDVIVACQFQHHIQRVSLISLSLHA